MQCIGTQNRKYASTKYVEEVEAGTKTHSCNHEHDYLLYGYEYDYLLSDLSKKDEYENMNIMM